jgi:hypothetical protein
MCYSVLFLSYDNLILALFLSLKQQQQQQQQQKFERD